jgi:IgA-specific serine endopeptidase
MDNEKAELIKRVESLEIALQQANAEREASEHESDEWARKFSEYASGVMQSSQAAEDAARSMYEELSRYEREGLEIRFRKKLEELERNLLRVRQEREYAQKMASDARTTLNAANSAVAEARIAAQEARDALAMYQASEPARAKEARRQLASEFAAEKERAGSEFQKERRRLLDETRSVRNQLENVGKMRIDIETRASELAIALERQKRETQAISDRARNIDQERSRLANRVSVLESFIQTESERDLARENEILKRRISDLTNLEETMRRRVEELVTAEGVMGKLRTLYEKSLGTIRTLNGTVSETKTENEQLREIATRVTLENSKISVELAYLRNQMQATDRTVERMSKDIERMARAVRDGATDEELVAQNEKLRVAVTEQRKLRKECESKLFSATQRFERELSKATKGAYTPKELPQIEVQTPSQ